MRLGLSSLARRRPGAFDYGLCSFGSGSCGGSGSSRGHGVGFLWAYEYPALEVQNLLALCGCPLLDRHAARLRICVGVFFRLCWYWDLVVRLILKEPDLGTPLLLGATGLLLLFYPARGRFISSGPWPVSPSLSTRAFSCQLPLSTPHFFMNPWADAAGAGFQLTQSLLAFAPAGFWGKAGGLSAEATLFAGSFIRTSSFP